MKIKSVTASNHRKVIVIDTKQGEMVLPYTRLRLRPSADDGLTKIYVDPELANESVTYVLESGKEDSVPLDAFLDYNRDPDYVRRMAIYTLSITAADAFEKTDLSKREIARRLNTSPAQLYRLVDTANYRKTVDQLIKLLAVLRYTVDISVSEARDSLPTTEQPDSSLKNHFPYLDEQDLKSVPSSSTFKPLWRKAA